MNERIKNLYKTIILSHNSKPYFFEKKENSGFVLNAYNSICGDRFNVFFEIENGKISEITFHGFGCAISKASTSVLVKNLKGKKLEEALLECRQFLSVTQPDSEPPSQMTEEFEAFSAAKEFPGRLKCATLAWDEMIPFLEEKMKE